MIDKSAVLDNVHRKVAFEGMGGVQRPSVRFQGEGLRRRCSDRSFNHDVEETSLSLFLPPSFSVPFVHSRRIIARTSRVLTLARLSLEIAATPTPLSRVHGSGTINNAHGGHYLSLTLRTPVFTTKGERVRGNRRPARLVHLQRDPFPAKLNFSTTIASSGTT